MTTPDAGWPGSLPGWPAFIRELAGTLAARSEFVLQGNIRDIFLVPAAESAGAQSFAAQPRTTLALIEALWQSLRPSGYRCLITYDPVHGMGVYPPGPASLAEAERLLGPGVIGGAPTLGTLRCYLAAVAGVAPPAGDGQPPADRRRGDAAARRDRPRVAFLIDYAARITRSPDNLEAEERDFFLFCLKLSHVAERCAGGPPGRPLALFNPIIWLVEGERDLPAWLMAGSERIRTIIIGLPDLETRQELAGLLARDFGIGEPTGEQRRLIARFAERTRDLSLFAMREITRMAIERQMPFEAVDDAIRIYKLGVSDNPWRRASVKHRIAAGAAQITATATDQEHDGVKITERVFGQDRAVGKTIDILKRAALGLSGAQASNPGSRPRGVIFFAGPTGVGKTELAKATAALLFGGTGSFLRFDMSEFAAEHSDHRLMGSPPGYVGFEAGGELTSAVRAQPFQVVLFDEIDKAHKRVLDKFLQILEDGRLTDGHGVTTYFSECVLIFTSNLGVMAPETTDEPRGRVATVSWGDSDAVVEEGIRNAIAYYFKTVLGRPELLNRFGDNIVVFSFISEAAAEQIFGLQVENIARQLKREQELVLVLTDAARSQLLRMCTANLDNGGRGIGNVLESALINPLGRELFDKERAPGSTIVVSGVSEVDGAYALTLGSAADRGFAG